MINIGRGTMEQLSGLVGGMGNLVLGALLLEAGISKGCTNIEENRDWK